MLICIDGEIEGRGNGVLALTIADVNACFQGAILARATRIARLTQHQLLVLFPRSSDARKHALNMKRIGKRIACNAHREAADLEACKQCQTARALAGVGFNALVRAARYTDPGQQLRAAAAADIGGDKPK